jgi:hypothetical protein
MHSGETRPPSLESLRRLAGEPLLGPDAALYLTHLTPQELRQLSYLVESRDAAAIRDFWTIVTQAGTRRRRPLSTLRRSSQI